MIYGAILGDIIGSRFEFDVPNWKKEFELFTPECKCTDDTVMTLAIARAFELVGKDANEEEIKSACVAMMQMYGAAFPDYGYGARFNQWIYNPKPQPYYSCGNGSAMRVSLVGWLYDDLDKTREVARWTAEVTHNHPEGIKGAEATATAIWMARNGYAKQDIEKYMIDTFGYDVSTLPSEYRANHRHDETCQDTIPKALVAFFEGGNFEDVVREAVSYGGDTDTIAAIAGSIAEAYYGIPKKLINEGTKFLPGILQFLVDEVENKKED